MSDERNTIVPAKVEAASEQAEQSRRAELSRQVLEQFTNQGDKYRYKQVPDVVAFTDHGDKLTTDLDNEDVAEAMANLAESKGWMIVKASGSARFYDTVERTQKALIEQQQAAKEPTPEPADDAALSNTVNAEKASITTPDESEQLRRQALAQSVNDQYRVAGAKYYFKDQAGNINQLAFKDNGAKLSTALNTERVTRSLVDLAEAKGWTDIKISGHREFKRQVWRAATERGIEVRGYTPDARDLATVSDKAMKNTVEPVTAPAPEKVATPRQKTSRGVAGMLIEHGVAPYQNKPDNKASYYVTIDTGENQRTVWGVALPDAIAKSNVKTGDKVRVLQVGSKPVTVEDKDGKQVSTVRNSWTIERDDKREVIAAVAGAVAAQHVSSESDRRRIAEALQARMDTQNGPLPQVNMYDNNATQTAVVEPAKAKTKAPELIR